MPKRVPMALIGGLFAFAITAWVATGFVPRLQPATFANPIGAGQDPSIVRAGNTYYWCQSDGSGIWISNSDSLTRIGERQVVWTPPTTGSYSKEIWAPQLVRLNDRYYIYVACSDGNNVNHRTYVLASEGNDPLGRYEFYGPLYTGNDIESGTDNHWAIDMTVLQHSGRLYAVWSGWTTLESDVQCLYIATMSSPTMISSNRVLISRPDDYIWERIDETIESRGLNEGPEVLKHDGRTFLVYSCAASWLPTYKLGMLELVGENPLDIEAWKKFDKPVFQSTATTFGVGHGCFSQSPDGTEWWHIYHAKDDFAPGWRRSLFAQPMTWNADGTPNFGKPVKRGQVIKRPSGDTADD